MFNWKYENELRNDHFHCKTKPTTYLKASEKVLSLSNNVLFQYDCRNGIPHIYVLFDPKSITKYFLKNMRFTAAQKYTCCSKHGRITNACYSITRTERLRSDSSQPRTAAESAAFSRCELVLPTYHTPPTPQHDTHGQRVGRGCMKQNVC